MSPNNILNRLRHLTGRSIAAATLVATLGATSLAKPVEAYAGSQWPDCEPLEVSSLYNPNNVSNQLALRDNNAPNSALLDIEPEQPVLVHTVFNTNSPSPFSNDHGCRAVFDPFRLQNA